jgi:hypothetical protein
MKDERMNKVEKGNANNFGDKMRLILAGLVAKYDDSKHDFSTLFHLSQVFKPLQLQICSAVF